MNCDKCCGCVPPITTYNPSVADNFPTILQQVEYLKAMLKKYPSQQWFITQEKVTEDTIKLDRTKVSLRGRDIAEGDFILGNTEDGTTLMFQYTGATIELTNYVVEFVGIYSNQGLAEQALSLAQTNEQDIAKLDSEIIDKVNKVEKGALDRIYGVDKTIGETFFELSYEALKYKIPRYDEGGRLSTNAGVYNNDTVNLKQLKDNLNSIFDEKSQFLFYGKIIQNPTNSGVMVVDKSLYRYFKTIFGNQSLVGEGNIDLYKHAVEYYSAYNNTEIKFNFEFYSSKNIDCDSLTDLKTILGNTFIIPVSGYIQIDGVSYYIMNLTNENITYIDKNGNRVTELPTGTFTDTVTTI